MIKSIYLYLYGVYTSVKRHTIVIALIISTKICVREELNIHEEGVIY